MTNDKNETNNTYILKKGKKKGIRPLPLQIHAVEVHSLVVNEKLEQPITVLF